MAKQISPISDRRRIHVTPRLSSIQISARDTCPYFRPRAGRNHVCGPIHGKTSRIYSINSYTIGCVASCYEFLQSDRVNRVNDLLSLFFFL